MVFRSTAFAARASTAENSAGMSPGSTAMPRERTAAATWVPSPAVATTGRPLASMPVSFEGMTRSAAPERCGSR